MLLRERLCRGSPSPVGSGNGPDIVKRGAGARDPGMVFAQRLLLVPKQRVIGTRMKRWNVVPFLVPLQAHL
jgi:hypothetical protein